MIKFDDILSQIDYIDYKKQNDININKISNNSKKVKENDIFVAVVGELSDSHKYIDDAIDNGAKTIVYEKDIAYKDGINYIKVKDSRKTLAIISNILEDNPSKNLTIVGVTGTNGKTTTATTIYYLMSEFFGKATNIGTDGAFIEGVRRGTENTTPDIMEINEILSKTIEKDIKYVVLEASSHGLYQKRLYGVEFDYGIFTNLSTEHLDYHKTIEDYFDAKMILFENSKNTIANIDDEYGAKAKERYPETITYSIEKESDYKAYDIKKHDSYISFKLKDTLFKINTIADYEVYNSLGSIVTLNQMGIELREISKKLSDFKGIASRFEFVENDLNKNIVIDFAHTPVAYEEIFKSIPKGSKTIAVFGINGDRNEEFRKLIGNACAKNGVFAVITTDDPKFDTYENITDQIIAGIKEYDGDYKAIKDRKEAIEYAIKKADEGDYILVLGKGEEHFMKYHGNEKTPYNELLTIKEVINSL